MGPCGFGLIFFEAFSGRVCCSCGSFCSCCGGSGSLFGCLLFLCLTAAFLCGACGCFCLSRGFSFLLGRSLLRPVCCFGVCILRVACSLPLLLLLPCVPDFGGLWLDRGRLLGRVGPGELVLAVKVSLQRRQFFLCGLGLARLCGEPLYWEMRVPLYWE